MATPKIENVVIIGSGPAGHTAAIYAARASLSPLMFEGMMAGGIAAGGQLTTTSELENFPGFPEGVSGLDFTDKLRQQSERFGTRIETKTVSKIEVPKAAGEPFRLWCEYEEEDAPVLARSVIIATGATARRLRVPGEEKYWQKGISACAVCDGGLPIFRSKPLAVIGGGDSACEEALYLTKYASVVHLLHRRDALRASKVMVQRVLEHPKIQVHWNTTLSECIGDKKLQKLVLEDTVTHAHSELEVSGLFFAIGHQPNTGFLKDTGVNMDAEGYIVTEAGSSKTTVEGLFACGDCQDKKYRQAVVAAGSGCMAALDCEHWLGAKGYLA